MSCSGVSLVFELPVLIFFLTLLRIVTPAFLVRNSRYAILVIVIVAAIVTPTPDVVNLMLFAVPMCLLFYVGILGGYLLVLHREHRRFPWAKVLPWVGPGGGDSGGGGMVSERAVRIPPHQPLAVSDEVSVTRRE